VAKLGGRDLGRIIRAPMSGGHWRALAGMPRVYRRADLAEVFNRFLRGRGEYPWVCAIRTPIGIVRPELYTRDDLLTVNEIFARRDYEAPATLGVAVDVGANIGLAALYFLTRNTTSRVYSIEPNPRNLARIPRTLEGLAERYEVLEFAAAEADGEATFYIEETGRYGSFGKGWRSESITVRTRSFTEMLDEILAREERIDLLKIDTEGSEEELVSSIPERQLDRIDRIYYETNQPEPFHLDRYSHHFDCQTNALIRHGLSR
jgi:FkbM family methyltransferase